MRVPALSYQAKGDPDYDNGFYRLPNALSHQCGDFSTLRDIVRRILVGEVGAAGGAERHELMAGYLASQDGPLASQRIVDVLEKIVRESGHEPTPSSAARFRGKLKAARRRLAKTIKSFQPNSKYRSEFQRYRYPGLSIWSLRQKIKQFQSILGDQQKLDIQKLGAHVFRITPDRSS